MKGGFRMNEWAGALFLLVILPVFAQHPICHDGGKKGCVATVAAYEREQRLPTGEKFRVFSTEIDKCRTNCTGVIFYVVRPKEIEGRLFRLAAATPEFFLPLQYDIGKAYSFEYLPPEKESAYSYASTAFNDSPPIFNTDLIHVKWCASSDKMSLDRKFGTRLYLTREEVLQDLRPLEQKHNHLARKLEEAERLSSTDQKMTLWEWETSAAHSPRTVRNYIRKNLLPKNEERQKQLREVLRGFERKAASDSVIASGVKNEGGDK